MPWMPWSPLVCASCGRRSTDGWMRGACIFLCRTCARELVQAVTASGSPLAETVEGARDDGTLVEPLVGQTLDYEMVVDSDEAATPAGRMAVVYRSPRNPAYQVWHRAAHPVEGVMRPAVVLLVQVDSSGDSGLFAVVAAQRGGRGWKAVVRRMTAMADELAGADAREGDPTETD